MSVVGGLAFPVTTALAGALWIFARMKWAKGYATGEPQNRYEKSDGWGRHIWTALLALTVTCAATGLQCLQEAAAEPASPSKPSKGGPFGRRHRGEW